MDSLDILREIGIREIARRTHIEPQIISMIIDKDFDGLCKYNADGYIKIIVREFDIDMSEWLSEYAQAKALQKSQRTCCVVDKIPPITNSAEKTNSKSGFGFFGIIVIIAIVVAFYLFADRLGFYNLINPMGDKNNSISYSSESEVAQASKNIQAVTKDALESEPESDLKVADNTVIELSKSEGDLDISQKTLSLANDKNNTTDFIFESEKNNTVLDNKDLELDSKTTKKNNDDDNVVQKNDKATLKTVKKVWVGIINLKTKSKKSYSDPAGTEYVLDLNIPQLVVAGNGNITISVNNNIQKYDPNMAARFAIKDGMIKKITYDEFVRLNGGKVW